MLLSITIEYLLLLSCSCYNLRPYAVTANVCHMLLLALKHNPINYLTFKMHYVIVGVMSLEINKCYCDMLKATILSLRVLVVGKVE